MLVADRPRRQQNLRRLVVLASAATADRDPAKAQPVFAECKTGGVQSEAKGEHGQHAEPRVAENAANLRTHNRVMVYFYDKAGPAVNP